MNAPSKVAGVLEEYGKERPRTSKTELMVLALSDGTSCTFPGHLANADTN